MIVDSSAILAIFFREPRAEDLLPAVIGADFVGIGAPTTAETGLVLTSRMNHDATGSLLRFFAEAGIAILPFCRAELRRLYDVCDSRGGWSAAPLPR